MEITRAKWEINYVCESRDQERRAFFEKQGTDGIKITLLVGMLGQLNKILEILDSEAGLKWRSWGVLGEKSEWGTAEVELLARERRSLDILSEKKEARLSARAQAEVKEIWSGFKSLFVVCQRPRGLSEDEETKLQKR